MVDAAIETTEKTKKPAKMLWIISVCLALAGAGGGYFAVQSGLLGDAESLPAASSDQEVEPLADIAYVPIEPMLISLSGGQQIRHLRFGAQLEVFSEHAQDVTLLMPRVQDVLNGYLRAVRPSDLEDSFALTRLRGQMLRRIQVVVGNGRVRDLLITEFVLN